jgi:hypothetical protein
MIIPGFLVTILTFPGVIVHEAAHMLFCKMRGIAVFDVCFFRFENPCGYVVHEKIDDFTSAFLVSVGPFILNSFLCIFICLPAYLPMQVFNIQEPLSLVLMWLGLSIGMHAFPSNQDAANLFAQSKEAAASLNPLAILSFPLVLVIFVANVASIFWADLFYALALGIGLPSLVL